MMFRRRRRRRVYLLFLLFAWQTDTAYIYNRCHVLCTQFKNYIYLQLNLFQRLYTINII